MKLIVLKKGVGTFPGLAYEGTVDLWYQGDEFIVVMEQQ